MLGICEGFFTYIFFSWVIEVYRVYCWCRVNTIIPGEGYVCRKQPKDDIPGAGPWVCLLRQGKFLELTGLLDFKMLRSELSCWLTLGKLLICVSLSSLLVKWNDGNDNGSISEGCYGKNEIMIDVGIQSLDVTCCRLCKHPFFFSFPPSFKQIEKEEKRIGRHQCNYQFIVIF